MAGLASATRLQDVVSNARRLATPGKGILASDETTGTVGKRLKSVGLENTEENRRAYREVLYTTPGIGAYLNGVIIFTETLLQSTKAGIPFPDVLQGQGILVGVKVDLVRLRYAHKLPCTEGETVSQGLDGLSTRCQQYYNKGARFAKWREVIAIKEHCPSKLALKLASSALVRYASICQQEGLVPIPEILIDGTHSAEKSAEVAELVLAEVFSALSCHHVCLEGILLKPQMVLPGFDSDKKATREECAQLTIRTLQRGLPVAVPGIMFLSGGLSEEEATEQLNELNVIKKLISDKVPWTLSFSFGRALQASILRIWAGDASQVEAAQAMAGALARVNAMATLGNYVGPHPSKLTGDLRESFRGWRSVTEVADSK
eukprot:SM000011S19127  [mRNA]  locus=s11:1041917:1044596:+ [translate_table: standard]